MGGWGVEWYASLTVNSLTSSSYKQPQQRQNKTSNKPHGLRDWCVARWRTDPTTRLWDTLRGPEKGRLLGRGGEKPWQRRAAAPFTVVVNSEINGDGVRTSEGSCIVAAECFTRAFLSEETRLCWEHVVLVFSGCGCAPRCFLFKFQEHKASRVDMWTHRCCTNSVVNAPNWDL